MLLACSCPCLPQPCQASLRPLRLAYHWPENRNRQKLQNCSAYNLRTKSRAPSKGGGLSCSREWPNACRARDITTQPKAATSSHLFEEMPTRKIRCPATKSGTAKMWINRFAVRL